MITAIGNIRQGDTIVGQLLAKQGANIVITEETMIAAAGNTYHGETIIRELFARQGADIFIAKEIMITAIGNIRQGDTIVGQLLVNQGANIVITEEIVIAAIGNIYCGRAIIAVLLYMRGADINVTPEVMKAISRHRGTRRNESSYSTLNRDIMIQLLGEREANMDATEELIKMIISATDLPITALELLFKKQGEELRLTEGMVRIVEEKIPLARNILKRMKDNIQRYSSGGTSSAG